MHLDVACASRFRIHYLLWEFCPASESTQNTKNRYFWSSFSLSEDKIGMQSNIFFPIPAGSWQGCAPSWQCSRTFFSQTCAPKRLECKPISPALSVNRMSYGLIHRRRDRKTHTDAPIITCASKTRRLTTHSHLLHATDGRCVLKNVIDNMKPTGHYTNIFGSCVFWEHTLSNNTTSPKVSWIQCKLSFYYFID